MDLSSLPPLHGQIANARSSVEFRNDGLGIPGYLYDRDLLQDEDPSQVKTFGENDGEEAVKCLRRCFQVLEPGYHIARRAPDHGGSSFIHCRHSTQVGRRYLNLRQNLEERARVELMRDCFYRLKLSITFVRDLQQLVMDEYKVLYTITHDCVDELPVSKIFCLNALCEDLRTLIGHWKCIKQKLHTNRWLQPVLGSLHFQLDKIRLSLIHLQSKAIWWLEKFVLIGLQVFAHGNVDALTHEMIWNITRGLEDLNRIINGLQQDNHSSTSKLGLQSFYNHPVSGLSAENTNSLANIGEHVRAIPFSRVLSVLANERSKYAALETHRFFTTNHEFVKLLYSGKLPDFVWTEDSSHANERPDKDTSDYHTATGSMTSLSAAILKVGSIRAPDLSDSDSPLVELARREHSFAENFLLIVCNSTNLLRRNDNQKSKRVVKYSQSMASSSKPPRGDTPVLSRSDSLRKSVSWGDSADSSIKTQLTSRYMDLYWNHFGTSLYMMFYEPCWVRQKSLYFSEIGSVLMLNTTVIALVKHMIQHVCLKVSPPLDKESTSQSGPANMLRHPIDPMYPDIGVPIVLPEPTPDLFPPGSVKPLLKKSRKVFIQRFWVMCEALASNRRDKCYPCPLVNGDYSTRTGMLLRDTYQPVLNLLRENMAESVEPTPGGLPASVNEMVAVAVRLVSTSGVSLSWCRTKTHQYLASMAVGNFLLISQTDLKILIDESRSALYQTQMVSKSLSSKVGQESVVGLSQIADQLSTIMDSLQVSVSCSFPQTFLRPFHPKPEGKIFMKLKL
ncbi:uncharacterized protein LOC123547038 [Mercenaria mercenaria]|uniref:uncharacterized protein LOC123547038 n=1 Tax=Mercenaria mercenaria TaxID=6596 RepID=UPI00234E564B|nr:uncharacterized protein LOC123547038 [Mercenaria mercenaria]